MNPWENIQIKSALLGFKKIPKFQHKTIPQPKSAYSCAANLNMAQMQQQADRREQSLRSELQAIKENLESILSITGSMFMELDGKWRFTYVNERVVEIIGKNREELMGRCFWEVFPETVGTLFDHELHRAVENQVPVHFENFYTPLNLWFENHVYPKVNGVSVFANDITARKHAQEALKQSETRLKFALESTKTVCWERDLSNDRLLILGTFTQPAVSEVLSYQDALLQRVHPEDQAQVDQAAESAIANLGSFEVEHRLREDQNQDWRWVLVRGTVLADAMGKPDRIVGVTIDITERKQVELALRQSETSLKIAQNVAQVGMWEFDIVNQKIHWSQTTFENWGIDPSQGEPSYAKLLERVHPGDRELLQEKVKQALTAGIPYAFDLRIIRPDGSIKYLDSRGEAIFNDKGKPIKLIGTSLDITDRKQAEKEQEQLLERERMAREEAEAANRIKDEFLAVLSHELRSPLNPILGWCQLLQSCKLDETKTKAALATIERNVKLQTQLVEDLLDISRIISGKLSLNTSSVNLATIVIAALETARLPAEAKAIQIQTAIAPNVKSVSGDFGRLQQVIWNLLSNAIKFTPAGGRIEIRLEQVDSYAQIQVIDTGKGINPAFLPYIFEYFRQEDSTTTREFGGLGLGLAIARNIVELHGGTIKAESLGEGQTHLSKPVEANTLVAAVARLIRE